MYGKEIWYLLYLKKIREVFCWAKWCRVFNDRSRLTVMFLFVLHITIFPKWGPIIKIMQSNTIPIGIPIQNMFNVPNYLEIFEDKNTWTDKLKLVQEAVHDQASISNRYKCSVHLIRNLVVTYHKRWRY